MYDLRPYQNEAVSAALKGFETNKRLLGVAATGSGKTLMAAEIIHRWQSGNVLFLADATELVAQAADKLFKHTSIIPEIEMGAQHAQLGRCVVSTTQSMARRLDKYEVNDFSLIIIDEAHRNTLGAQAMKVLDHFQNAKVLGITATPFRSDKRELSEFYESICFEIPLPLLIALGYLSPITIKSVPCTVDLRNIRTIAGDYNLGDLDDALEPELMSLAELLKEHAPKRKTVVFLPLIRTSLMFCECCKKLGLNAVHVDGDDRSALHGDWQVICNSALLTTGWDEPSVDCVYILRPTKSAVLYSQMVGRGTRIFQGKENLLLLDPLFLSDDLSLIRPARLVAKSEEEAKFLQNRLDLEGGDLMTQRDRAMEDRQASMLAKARKSAQQKARTVDAIEFALTLNRFDIAEYAPEMKWEAAKISEKQKDILEKNGFATNDPRMCKGFASQILDVIFQRRSMGLCTPKQLRFLQKYNYPNATMATFAEASDFITARAASWKRN